MRNTKYNTKRNNNIIYTYTKKMTKKIFILDKKPKKYEQQRNFRECWLFNIKAVVESFYPKTKNKEAKEYASSKIHRIIRFSLPKQLCKTLKKYNIPYTYDKCEKKEMIEKINFLKKQIKKWPIIILISHAYTKNTSFNILKAIIKQHYISIRWYNDIKEVFYCYDSHTELIESDLPIGNIKIHYQDLITYRSFAWLWLFKKRYIAIH